MAPSTTSCFALVAALALGCTGKGQSSDAAADAPPRAGCGGTLNVSGTSPEGSFTATSVYATVAAHTSTCQRGLHFAVADSATRSSFAFELPVDAVDGGATFPLGTTSATVTFNGAQDTDARRFVATTTATIDVTAADPPPFAVCEQAGGDPIGLQTGNIAMAIMMSQDGFAIAGTLSTPYCACEVCPDTI